MEFFSAIDDYSQELIVLMMGATSNVTIKGDKKITFVAAIMDRWSILALLAVFLG